MDTLRSRNVLNTPINQKFHPDRTQPISESNSKCQVSDSRVCSTPPQKISQYYQVLLRTTHLKAKVRMFDAWHRPFRLPPGLLAREGQRLLAPAIQVCTEAVRSISIRPSGPTWGQVGQVGAAHLTRIKSQIPTAMYYLFSTKTVAGRNPEPPGMYKTLQIMG